MMQQIRKQAGATTLMVIIVLAALLFVIVALLRSSEATSNLTSSVTFQQAAKSASDVAVYLAMQNLLAKTNYDTTVNNQYYAVKQSLDSNGLPAGVNWDQVPTQQIDNYTVQYVIERLCSGTLPIAADDIKQQCVVTADADGGSKKLGAAVYEGVSNQVYYRISVRVSGPKDTLVYVQSIIAK